MTVSQVATYTQAPGNGSAVAFDFPFLIFETADLVVGFIDSLGNYVQQTSGFSVAGIGFEGQGVVTFVTPPAAGITVDIRSLFPNTQPTNFANFGAYFPETNTKSQDRLERQVQDLLRRTYTFGIHGPDTEDVPWPALPVPAARAGGVIFFDANGLPSVGFSLAVTLTQAIWDGFVSGSAQLPPYLLAWLKASIPFAQTPAEAAIPVTPSATLIATSVYDTRRYGATLAGADDTTAVKSALSVAAQTVGGALGGAVSMATGVSQLSSMIFLPNRVRVLGINKRGSYLQATSGWTVGNGVVAYNGAVVYQPLQLVTSGGVLYIAKQPTTGNAPPNSTYWDPISPAMFYAQNGYVSGVGQSMFDSTLENLAVDCNNVAGLGGVLASAWQEDCGMRGALILNFATYGVRLQDGYGGASLTRISDTEIFGGTTAGAIGIDLQQISLVGSFLLKVSDTSITGSPGVPLAKGINVVNDSLHADTVHFEQVTSCIYLDGVGHHVIIGCTGGPSTTNLVELASTFTGTLTMLECFRNGATNLIKDNRSGGLGTISYDLDHVRIDATANLPSRSPGSVWMAGIFNGAGSVSSFTGMNCSTPVRNSAGNYTIAATRTAGSAARSAGATCNLAAATIQTSVSAGSINIIISVAGTPTDSNEIHFWDIILQ